LFDHGYGCRKIVYESNILLRGMFQDNELIDMSQRFRLEDNLPKEIIIQYIGLAYTGFFDTDCIEESEEHFIDFLKFIDQYR
jgi:hypothetical protein